MGIRDIKLLANEKSIMNIMRVMDIFTKIYLSFKVIAIGIPRQISYKRVIVLKFNVYGK